MKFRETASEGAEMNESVPKVEMQDHEISEAEQYAEEQPDEIAPKDNRVAFKAISDYYGRNNYGPEHFAQYSQDPEWRKLFLEAYPDKELPPLCEREKLKYDAFITLPSERRLIMRQTFENAPAGIIQTINDVSDNLCVDKTEIVVDDNGVHRYEACHFNERTKEIRMNPSYNDERYSEVLTHELGHYIDDFRGKLSGTEAFKTAIDLDMEKFRGLEGNIKKEQMLKELAESGVIESNLTSDILSGAFHNDARIYSFYCETTYEKPAVHENLYWDEVEGPKNAVQKETFANLFAVYSGKGVQGEIGFLEKYFPETTACFKKNFNIEE